jgi:hypothetical protein
MGLFDPPSIGIRKRVPSAAHPQFDQLRSLTDDAVPAHLSRTQIGLVVGFVMAAWALSEHRRGKLPLDKSAGTYISNMGLNCARMLGSEEETALSMVRHLIENGVIDEAT